MSKQYQETLLRRKEIERRTGLARSTIYDLIKRGEFPAPIQLHGRCVAWPESTIQAWIDERVNTVQETNQ